MYVYNTADGYNVAACKTHARILGWMHPHTLDMIMAFKLSDLFVIP